MRRRRSSPRRRAAQCGSFSSATTSTSACGQARRSMRRAGADLDDEVAGSDGRLRDQLPRRGQAEGSSDRDGAVARPAASACPRTRKYHRHAHTPLIVPRQDAAARRWTGGRRPGQPWRRSPALRPLDLTLDVGPHQRLVLAGGLGRLGPRHDHERHRPQDGDRAQLGQEAGQLLVEQRRQADHRAVVAERRVQRVAGEDPDDGEEARHDRLHDQVPAPAESRQARGARELGEDGRPQDEARGQHDELDHDPGHVERAARLTAAGRQRRHGDDRDDGHRRERPDHHPQNGVDRGRPRQPGDQRPGGPEHQQRRHGQGEQQALERPAPRAASGRPGRRAATSRQRRARRPR